MKRFNHIYQVTCLVLILSSFASNIFADDDWVQPASAVYVKKYGDSKFYNTKSEGHGAFDAQSNAINPGGGDWQSILFNGQNFGAHTTQSGTLILRAAEVKTAKWGTGHVCAPYLNWVIYTQGNRPASPAFTESEVNHYQDCNGVQFPDTYGSCSTGWQKWQTGASGGASNLLSQVTADLTNRNEGNYSVEIFYRLSGSLSGSGC
ncbi:MAG TPA: hypothetical protein PKW38_01955, partial [Paludibacteraceae bacterium]|nr:hypothetical protein [Paludibacteraceae bacterium]